MEAQCAEYVLGDKNIAFQTNLLSIINETANNGSWEVPESVLKLATSPSPSNQEVIFRWVDMSVYNPSISTLLGGVFISTNDEIETAIYPCTLAAYYTPVNVWYDPNAAATVFQDTPDPMDIVKRLSSAGDSEKQDLIQPIEVSPTWLDGINTPNYEMGWNHSDPSTNLTLLEAEAASFGFLHGDLTWKLSPAGPIPFLFATVLSMQLADGLARVNFGYETLVIKEYTPNSDNHTGRLHDLDNVNIGGWGGQPSGNWEVIGNYAATARTTNSSHNTEILWKVDRFGYGWGFTGNDQVTLGLGVAILLVHAAIVVAYVTNVMMTNAVSKERTLGNWNHMGEMIALAVGSREPSDGSLDNTSAGIERLKTWGVIVRVRNREIHQRKTRKDDDDDGPGDIDVSLDDETSRNDQELGATVTSEEPERRRLQLVFGSTSTGIDPRAGEGHGILVGKKYN